jgi:thiamine kinase-like enzyme
MWLGPLGTRDWPVAIQHGDLTPWNLLRTREGRLQVVDWEHGSLEGFPCIDLAHYILQTSALIHLRSPSDAAREAIDCLLSRKATNFCLSEAQARAIVSLAAYEAYLMTCEDGQRPDARLQSWRRTIWSSDTQHYSGSQGAERFL